MRCTAIKFHGKRLWLQLISGLYLLLAAAPLWAQQPRGSDDDTVSKSYTMQYMLVVLVVALGLLVVVRPVGRRSEVKPASDE